MPDGKIPKDVQYGVTALQLESMNVPQTPPQKCL